MVEDEGAYRTILGVQFFKNRKKNLTSSVVDSVENKL